MTLLRLGLCVMLVLTVPGAMAHTQLAGSVPADHAMLDSAPEEIMLHFSEPVRLTALTVETDGDAAIDLGPLPAEPGQHFTFAAPSMAHGHHTVSWRALSEDTHVINGTFMFMVGVSGDHAQHMDHSDHGATHDESHAPAGDHSEHVDSH